MPKDGTEYVPHTLPLRDHVARMVSTYFHNVGGLMPMQGLHELVMSEVEQPLLEITLQFTQGNMAQAAKILGISRATLRKKLEHYGVIQS
jgi:Fis family transcriptional regulator